MSRSSQQIRFCKSRDGARIAYATCGKGPTLLFAQHWVHHLDHDWDSPLWRSWLELLAKNHTVVRFDWRGCGLSDRDVEFSAEKYVEDFEAVVSAASLEKFPIVGISNGGIFGAAYAGRHPDRVTSMFLIAIQARGRLGARPMPEEIEAMESRLKIIELGWSANNAPHEQFVIGHHFIVATLEQRKAHQEILRQTSTAETATKLLRTFARADLRELLPQITCPTVVLHSRFDPLLPFDDAREAAALIPEARFIPLESSNHLLLDNEPGWAVMTAALNDFLRSLERGTESELAARICDLTPRERQVLEFVAKGLANDTIAARLGISEKTIRNQLSIIMSKLGVSSRAQTIVRAREVGFGQSNQVY